MRRLTHGDLVMAARLLFTVPPDQRRDTVVTAVFRATCADLYRKRKRHAHPEWGNGTLAAVVWRPDLPAEPALSDPAYLQCLQIVLSVASLRHDYPCAQPKHRGTAGSSSSLFSEIGSPQSVQ